MYHLKGKARAQFSKLRYFSFADTLNYNICGVSKEADGTFLFYMRDDVQKDLAVFFDSYEVIARKTWDPAFRMGPRSDFKSEILGENVFQAGSLNIEGLEDAFLSGRFVASKIKKEIFNESWTESEYKISKSA